MTTVVTIKKENGKFVAEFNGTVLTEVKASSNLYKNAKAKLDRMGIDITDVKFVKASTTTNERVFVKSKKDAKPGNYIILFGTQTFVAYEKEDGTVGFKKV